MSANISVIWRMPNETQVFALEEGEGADAFIYAPFLSELHTYLLKGKIQSLDDYSIHAFFSDWKLANSQNEVSSDDEVYLNNVEKAKSAIINQQIEKVVLARNRFLSGTFKYEKVFHALLKNYPEAFVYAIYIQRDNCMMGASPEQFLQKKEDCLYTEALGGTLVDGQFSEKEVKEHEHIRSFMAEKFTQLDFDFAIEPFIVKKAGSLSHLQSKMKAKAKDGKSHHQLIKALHPTPAICGLPKEQAMDFILKNEDFEREYYGGYLGPVFSNGDFSWFVNLRSGKLFKNGVLLYAGAGINEMSVAADELEETKRKMSVLESCL
jgi:isochorismate synthase